MKRLVLVGVLVLVLGLLGAGTVLAQQGGDDGGPVRTFIAKVATKLGVSEEQLQGAITEARQEMLDEAVAEGRLTPEQAERLRERVDKGDFFPPLREDRPDHARRHGPCQRVQILIVDSTADVLGVEKGRLLSEIKAGKSLAEIAEAQGFSAERFQAALLAQVRQTLDGLVAEGKLTERQASKIFQGIDENIDKIVNGHFEPHSRPCDDHGRHRRPHGDGGARPFEDGLPPGDGE